jgi:hypothetical protein
MLIAALFTSFATLAMAQGGGTSPPTVPPAKRQPPATSGMGTTPDAPVGHRQPTQKSLPPQLRNYEGSPAAPDPLGPLPKICNGC